MGSVGDLRGVNLRATVSESHDSMDGGLPADQNDQASEVSSCDSGETDLLDTKLWHACAGPRVYVPRAGEKVCYFPQGHMEQVEAFTQQNDMMEMPIYNVPSKILCKVVHVHLKAEAQTDEVFAQVALLPEPEQDKLSLQDETALASPQRTSVCSFVKKLTASDTSPHGGFSVRKPHACKCFPPLDMSRQPPVQDLVAKDLQGFEWNFHHIYRGRPKRHLLTSGWSTFVTAKRLVAAGDACIFLRGENGQLRVGVRRVVKPLNNASTSVISGCSMHHGILASASHAVSTGTLFTVYYHPWTSPSEFIIPSKKYMKLAENVYSVGMRFTMPFEWEECSEKRSPGTIIGVENVDCIRWPGSEWRCLKVKWDCTSNTFLHPERVSPWNIEPIESTNNKPTSTISERKRMQSINSSLPGFSSLTRDGFFHGSIGYASKRHKEVLQGQENKKTSGQELDAETPPTMPHLLPLSDPDWCHRMNGLENKQCFPMHDHFHQHNRSTIMAPFPTDLWPPIFANRVCDKISISRKISVSNVTISNSGSQEFGSSESRDENDTPLSQPTSCARYMPFGVNLANSHPELPSLQVATYCEPSSPCSFPPTFERVSETIGASESAKNSPGVLLKKQCEDCPVTNRSCTKVLKHGTALGRSVDLVRFNGYDELIFEFDEMFDFKGSLIDGSNGWHVTYIDQEGDMMLIGDCTWQYEPTTYYSFN